MVLHIRKLCVGADSVADLEEWQAGRRAQHLRDGIDPDEAVWHVTRTYPKRAAEILEGGGSLYWIIKGIMCVRQPIRRFDEVVDGEGRPACKIVFDPVLVPVEPRPHRPFQGWRYLDAKDAPLDLGAGGQAEGLPPEMAAELRALGLW